MITDDERKEVARGLRELETCLFDDGEYIDCGEVEEALGLVNDDGAWYRADGVMRLADLIEPEPERTCRNTSPMSYKFTCSECHSSYRFGCEHGVWYCPFCGAKVVGND